MVRAIESRPAVLFVSLLHRRIAGHFFPSLAPTSTCPEHQCALTGHSGTTAYRHAERPPHCGVAGCLAIGDRPF